MYKALPLSRLSKIPRERYNNDDKFRQHQQERKSTGPPSGRRRRRTTLRACQHLKRFPFLNADRYSPVMLWAAVTGLGKREARDGEDTIPGNLLILLDNKKNKGAHHSSS